MCLLLVQSTTQQSSVDTNELRIANPTNFPEDYEVSFLAALIVSASLGTVIIAMSLLCLLLCWKRHRRHRLLIMKEAQFASTVSVANVSPPVVSATQQVSVGMTSADMRRAISTGDLSPTAPVGIPPRNGSLEKMPVSLSPRQVRINMDMDRQAMMLGSSSGSPSTGGSLQAKIGFSLFYDVAHEVLYVRIMAASNLPPNPSRGTLDPFVRVTVIPGKFRKQTTRTKRRTTNPVFNDELFFPVKKDVVEHKFVKIKVLDLEKPGKEKLVGCVVYSVREAGLDPHEGAGDVSTSDIWRPLEEPRSPNKATTDDNEENPTPEHRGQLQISLRYDSTPLPGVLTLRVLQARELGFNANEKKLVAVYVRVSLMEKQEVIKSKKTRVVRRSCRPIFDDTFGIDLPESYLDNVSFSFYVFAKTRLGSKFLLGTSSAGPVPYATGPGVEQWNDMTHQKGSDIIRWHPITQTAQVWRDSQ